MSRISDAKQLSASKMQEYSDLMLENGMDQEYTVQEVARYNSLHSEQKKSKFGIFMRFYEKTGWIFSGIAVPLFIFGIYSTSIFMFIGIMAFVFAILLWSFVKRIYLENYPLKHCNLCKGFCSRKIIYEAAIPGQAMETVEEKTVSDTVKSKDGTKIGEIERTVLVNVRKEARWTVCECKKCHTREIWITVYSTEQ